MKPVDQTTFGAGRGNCFSACIASVLELGIEDVPNFCTEEQDADGSDWLERTATWLKANGHGGIVSVDWQTGAAGTLPLNCWVICTGIQNGGKEHHAVVGFTLGGERGPGSRPGTYSRDWQVEYVHDPNPRRSNLEAIESLIFLVPGPK